MKTMTEEMDIFELSNQLLSNEDKLLLQQITNYSYDNLMRDINNCDVSVLEKIYSDEKIINDIELNKKGLHIYRILLARRIEQYRRKNLGFQNHNLYKEWEERGIVILPNFLDENKYNELLEYSNLMIENKQPFSLDLSQNYAFQELLSMAASAPSTVQTLGSEYVDFDNIDPNEEQYHLHSDTFQPCIKIFYYINEIKEDEGPFCFVPTSNHVENPELLKWLYKVSCIALDLSHEEYDNILPSKLGTLAADTWGKAVNITFSPRLGRRYNDSVLNKHLDNMNLPPMMPIIGKGNTLVIANTSGFHRRNRAKKGTIRTTLRNGQRFNPFMV